MQTEQRLFGFTSEQDIRERATYRCDKLLQILLVSYSSHLLFLMSLRTGPRADTWQGSDGLSSPRASQPCTLLSKRSPACARGGRRVLEKWKRASAFPRLRVRRRLRPPTGRARCGDRPRSVLGDADKGHGDRDGDRVEPLVQSCTVHVSTVAKRHPVSLAFKSDKYTNKYLGVMSLL